MGSEGKKERRGNRDRRKEGRTLHTHIHTHTHAHTYTIYTHTNGVLVDCASEVSKCWALQRQ